MSTLTLIWATVPDSAMAIVLDTPATRVVGNVHRVGGVAPEATTSLRSAAADLERDDSRRRRNIRSTAQTRGRPFARIRHDAADRAMPGIAP